MRYYSSKTTTRVVGWLMVATLGVPAGARAQGGELAALCERLGDGAEGVSCQSGAQGLLAAQARLLLAQAGGNPVPGTASTLGMRLGSMPRWALGGRLTLVELGDLPSGTAEDGVALESAKALGASADVTIGLFPGFSPAATVGGVLALDLLGSGGLVFTSEDDGFSGDPVFGWGVGARLGVLRESFTLPGISLSLMYRALGDVDYTPPGGRPWTADASSLSLRGALSKDVLGFGLAGGGGVDRVRASMGEGASAGGSAGASTDVTDNRVTAFGSVAYSLLVAHAILEVGWQAGTDGVPGAAAVVRDAAASGGWYGSIALRLSI